MKPPTHPSSRVFPDLDYAALEMRLLAAHFERIGAGPRADQAPHARTVTGRLSGHQPAVYYSPTHRVPKD